MTGADALYALGFALIFIGVLVIIIAVILVSVSGAKKGGKVRAGGAVLIGPVPIIFGTDKKSLKTVLMLSMALTVMLIVAMVVYYLLFR